MFSAPDLDRYRTSVVSKRDTKSAVGEENLEDHEWTKSSSGGVEEGIPDSAAFNVLDVLLQSRACSHATFGVKIVAILAVNGAINLRRHRHSRRPVTEKLVPPKICPGDHFYL